MTGRIDIEKQLAANYGVKEPAAVLGLRMADMKLGQGLADRNANFSCL